MRKWKLCSVLTSQKQRISSINKKDKNSVGTWINEQNRILRDGSNQLGISLNWRIQHGEYGFGFHDRFIILKRKNRQARVWSLGTSINYYLEQNAYYTEKEPTFKTSDRGKIDWPQTLRKQRPLFQPNGSPVCFDHNEEQKTDLV